MPVRNYLLGASLVTWSDRFTPYISQIAEGLSDAPRLWSVSLSGTMQLMPPENAVFIVDASGILLAAYDREALANAHALTISGAKVSRLTVLTVLPDAVADDLIADQWGDDADTPVDILPRVRLK
jgi:hypothetical protein